jgi:hypothetical protein
MSKGRSLHIGLNRVDPKHYVDGDGRPWSGDLCACENDANALHVLAGGLGYEARPPLLTAAATADVVIEAIRSDSASLDPGDAYLVTYSGHGGQLTNVNPDADPEADRLDETWCLFDRQLIDDELFALWSQFSPGVRIVVLSDSCHSGTVTRGAPPTAELGQPRYKQLPREVAEATERINGDLYRSLQTALPSKRLRSLAATVVLMSGCRDDQYSRDGAEHGVFTGALLSAWEEPAARTSLATLHAATATRIPAAFDQTPGFLIYSFEVGPALAV